MSRATVRRMVVYLRKIKRPSPGKYVMLIRQEGKSTSAFTVAAIGTSAWESPFLQTDSAEPVNFPPDTTTQTHCEGWSQRTDEDRHFAE